MRDECRGRTCDPRLSAQAQVTRDAKPSIQDPLTMLGIHDYWLFVATGVLLNLTPGQDTLYILGRSIAQGRRIGVASALGISAGAVVHTLAAALGLSAVLATSASAFIALKVVGAVYLVYLGVRMLMTRTAALGASRVRSFFASRPRALQGFSQASGALFIFLG